MNGSTATPRPRRVNAPRRWIIASAVMIFMALGFCALFAWNIVLVQDQKDTQRTVLLQQGQIKELQAERKAVKQAENIASVTRCVNSAATGPDLNRTLDLIGVLARNQLEAAQLALATDPQPKLTPIRERVVRRTLPALESVRRITKRIAEQTPTDRECKDLARRLGVDLKKIRKTDQ